MNAALFTAAVGFTGILVGWFVSGSQRVNEELVKEHRAASAKRVRMSTDAGSTAPGPVVRHRGQAE